LERQKERSRRRWVDIIDMYRREIRWGSVDGIDLAQNKDWWKALMNSAMNFHVP
jgi:hypothetical protein